MLKPIKLTVPDHQLFFWSDTHWNHNRGFIYEPRGFTTIEDHDSALIHCWNEVCDEHSVVLHLGDIIFKADEAAFWTLLRRLRFRHLYLFEGNHTSGHRQAYASTLKAFLPMAVAPDGQIVQHIYPLTARIDGDPNRLVTFLPEYAEVSAGKTNLVCCHYPIASWHGISHEVLHLHGHCHGRLVHELPLRIDVGVDRFPKPVSLVELKRLTKGVKPAVVDHHGASGQS